MEPLYPILFTIAVVIYLYYYPKTHRRSHPSRNEPPPTVQTVHDVEIDQEKLEITSTEETETLKLNQCLCNNCDTTFWIRSHPNDFVPQFCPYCGTQFKRYHFTNPTYHPPYHPNGQPKTEGE